MQLTHFGHSCVLADFGHTTVLFDPGNFSHGFEGITGLSAIVITHQHPDHVDQERLPALLDGNPGAALYADPQTTEQLSVPVDVLATPAAAPWMKISEAVDYLRAVAPTRAVPIHQAVVAPEARGIYYGRLSEMTSADFQVLPEESAVTF
jgi:L-ascorbate metabolism protein UlaG (beta-lactamase superfamily)